MGLCAALKGYYPHLTAWETEVLAQSHDSGEMQSKHCNLDLSDPKPMICTHVLSQLLGASGQKSHQQFPAAVMLAVCLTAAKCWTAKFNALLLRAQLWYS